MTGETVDPRGRHVQCYRVARNPYRDTATTGYVWRGVVTLRIEKFSGSRTVTVDVDGETHCLTREEAAELRNTLDDELLETREFLRTTGVHRPDGSYEVRRRRAESTGHSKVFESFDELESLFGELPDEFTADDVEYGGVSGGRRHMLVYHLAEHPGFPCDLVSRQPVAARKRHVP